MQWYWKAMDHGKRVVGGGPFRMSREYDARTALDRASIYMVGSLLANEMKKVRYIEVWSEET